MYNQNLGKKGEEIACKHLLSLGYKILQRNFRCKIGEIDIIALDQGVLVFVEVKTRLSQDFGFPEEAVTPWKIRSIIKTGQYYSLLHPELPEALRIDVVAITMDQNENVVRLRLLKNATG